MTRLPNELVVIHEAAKEPDFIEVVGAREHNLQVEHLEIPKRKLVVFTGPSGSGKSSLAFDTLYAEGQRRYVETLSAYARQFLGQMERPKVEALRGLSPTIAIEQKSGAGNPRSTVGTITEIYDYLRVLYARCGTQHCPTCGKPVRGRSTEEIVREVMALGGKATITAPLVVHRKGEFKELFDDLRSRGFVRVEIDGELHKLEAIPPIDKKRKHTIHLVIDRVSLEERDRGRLAEAVELALKEGKGELHVQSLAASASERLSFSANRACCGRSFPELSPQSFSFNSPLGMCEACNGLGTRLAVDPELVIPDPSLTIRDGAIAPWKSAMERGEGWTFRIAASVAKSFGVDLDTPWSKIPKSKRDAILRGVPGKKVTVTWGQKGKTASHGTWDMNFHGVIPDLMRRYQQSTSESVREGYRRFMTELPCDVCEGKRLRSDTLHVRLAGKSIADLTSMTVRDAWLHVRGLELSSSQQTIAAGAIREIDARLGFLLNVGLDYLTLNRAGPTLSGGEAQRIRLASQLGSELSGVMYVLDEPSIGLHPRDNSRLIATLHRLRDLGNTVLVVEHDEETIRAADHVVDFGPGAGHLGGKVLFSGAPETLLAEDTITAQYLSGRKRIEPPGERRTAKGAIEVVGAAEHNLKNVNVKFPLGVLTAVTGVSGAGKSSLVNGILLPALARALHNSSEPVGKHRTIKGLNHIDRAIAIDQRPIGRTPRSNPGTYTKVFDAIRDFYAELPDSKTRGWSAGRFSFNVKGGRCEACSGDGAVKVEMHFLADVFVPCDVCGGLRYDAQTLSVRYKGKSIADILDTSIDECLEIFAAHPPIKRVMETLVAVGLGYMKLGQTATTMSGGEAQRVKLSRELGKTNTGRTLYVLDEPTTGLHFEDVRKLLGVLQALVDAGNTVVVIEHNLDVVRCADWVIDLGPEGGNGGGTIVAEGTPEDVARVEQSHTGVALRGMLV